MRRLLFCLILSCCLLTGISEGQFQGPRINIVLSDGLIGLPKDRKEERDESGNLLTQPGDVIKYTLITENVGTAEARDVEVVDPIPFGTEYILGSATGGSVTILFSINGGTNYVDQPLIEVRDATGKIIRKPAPASMYTHVKWIIREPLKPKQKKNLDLQVRVQGG